MTRFRKLVALFFLLGFANPANAVTYQYKDNNGATFNIEVFSCQAGPIYCTAQLFVDSTGTEKFTSGNPGIVAGAGTAGTPAGGVASVQGVSGGTALPMSAAAGVAVDGWNVTEGTKADAAWTSGSGSLIALAKAIAVANTSAIPSGANVIGYTSADPCAQLVKQNAAFATGGATNVQVVAPVSSKKVTICSMLLFGQSAHYNIIEGTGSACTTANEAAIVGSTTAANGMPLPASGGFAPGNGGGMVGVTATAGNGVCILTDASVQFAGNMMFVQQ